MVGDNGVPDRLAGDSFPLHCPTLSKAILRIAVGKAEIGFASCQVGIEGNSRLTLMDRQWLKDKHRIHKNLRV